MSNERDPAKHREARKLLAPAFSSNALRAQTVFVLKYVDMWTEQIKKHGSSGVTQLTLTILGETPKESIRMLGAATRT